MIHRIILASACLSPLLECHMALKSSQSHNFVEQKKKITKQNVIPVITYHTHVEFSPTHSYFVFALTETKTLNEWNRVWYCYEITKFLIISCVVLCAHCVKLYWKKFTFTCGWMVKDFHFPWHIVEFIARPRRQFPC